jgi:UDP-N-acetylglucosamine 2-epimerase (non-hydrolysing)/GDP/UDP-N,N'-diacetylbacillosamine 2-epimerase (hydrolysing)
LPVVNVGIRQQGRERAANVLDVTADSDAIVAAIEEALSPEFRSSVAGITNPYGDGHASDRIVEVLTGTSLESILIKAPAPIPADEEAR